MPKSPRFSPNSIRVIDVLAYPGVQLLDVTGPLQVFASANDLSVSAGGGRHYELRVVAKDGKDATASAGVALAAGPLSNGDEPLDTLLIAGGEGVEAAIEDTVLIDWVRERATQARRVASVCTGAFMLAAAGCWTGAARRRTGITAPSLPNVFPPCGSSPIRFLCVTVPYGPRPV
jgi:transcriptional regulator GlxA family with amidase domain